MSDTHIVDRNHVLRVVDSESFATAQYKASGLVDRDTTDFLEVTGNADTSDPGIQIAAKNDGDTDVDLALSAKGSGTVTITGPGGITLSGAVTANSGITVQGQAGGTVATASGLVGTDTGAGPVYTTTCTLTALTINVVDAGANGAHGSQKLYTFPQGHIKILGCVVDLAVVAGDTGLSASATYDIGIGSTATATDNAALATTEQDILTKQEGDLSTSEATIQACDSTDLTLDGTTTAEDAYLNIAVEADDASADEDVAFTGTVKITWVNLGDY